MVLEESTKLLMADGSDKDFGCFHCYVIVFHRQPCSMCSKATSYLKLRNPSFCCEGKAHQNYWQGPPHKQVCRCGLASVCISNAATALEGPNPSRCVPAASLLLRGLCKESSWFQYFLLAFLSHSSRVKECSEEFDTRRGILQTLMKSRIFQWKWELEEFELVRVADLESHDNSTGNK